MFPKELLDQVVINANDSVIICEDKPSLPIVFVNDAFVQLTGYSVEEALGKNPGRLLQGRNTNPITRKTIRQAIDNKSCVRAQLLNYKKTGEEYWVEVNIFPHFCETDGNNYFVSIQRDITDRRELEEALMEYKEFFDESPVALVRTDLETGRFLLANKMAARMLGYDSVADLIERERSVNLYSLDARRALIDEIKRRGEVVNYELQLEIQGQKVWVSANLKINCGGTCIEGSLVDITEMVHLKSKQLEMAQSLAADLDLKLCDLEQSSPRRNR